MGSQSICKCSHELRYICCKTSGFKFSQLTNSLLLELQEGYTEVYYLTIPAPGTSSILLRVDLGL